MINKGKTISYNIQSARRDQFDPDRNDHCEQLPLYLNYSVEQAVSISYHQLFSSLTQFVVRQIKILYIPTGFTNIF